MLIELLDTVSILDGDDILKDAIVWSIDPFTVTFLWQGDEITQPRAWDEMHTELSSKYSRNEAIEDILNMVGAA